MVKLFLFIVFFFFLILKDYIDLWVTKCHFTKKPCGCLLRILIESFTSFVLLCPQDRGLYFCTFLGMVLRRVVQPRLQKFADPFFFSLDLKFIYLIFFLHCVSTSKQSPHLIEEAHWSPSLSRVDILTYNVKSSSCSKRHLSRYVSVNYLFPCWRHT